MKTTVQVRLKTTFTRLAEKLVSAEEINTSSVILIGNLEQRIRDYIGPQTTFTKADRAFVRREFLELALALSNGFEICGGGLRIIMESCEELENDLPEEVDSDHQVR